MMRQMICIKVVDCSCFLFLTAISSSKKLIIGTCVVLRDKLSAFDFFVINKSSLIVSEVGPLWPRDVLLSGETLES
jgi:hypothetical protein